MPLFSTNPQGKALTFTYPNLTDAQINESPARQLQIATITDIQGNSAAVTYHTQQKGGLWVISQVNLNAGEEVATYTYTTNCLLESVQRASDVTSTYAYGMDTTYNLATLTWNERGRYNHSATGTKNALGHGSVTNRDSQGRSVHSATLEDFTAHTNLLDPLNSKTLSETTTKYRDDGRVKFQTVWKVPLGAIDRNNPPIAGVNGVAVADGLTSQYVYGTLDNATGLAVAGGVTINRLGGGTAVVTVVAALDKLKATIANGGAGIGLGVTKGTAGQATVVIAPDEKTMQVSVADGTGRGVMNATLTGPAASTPNQLVNWTCTLADQIDTTSTPIATLKTSQIDPDGKMTSAITDGFGRTVASIDQLGNITQQSYDSGGNLLKTTDALNRETTFVYDGLGRQTTVTAPLSNVRTTVYSSTNGRVTSRTDAKGVSTSYGYDLLSRVLTTTDRTGKLTTNTYNPAGQLATIVDAQAKTTSYVYNLLGQRTSTTLPDSSSKAMTYDAAGRVLEVTLALIAPLKI